MRNQLSGWKKSGRKAHSKEVEKLSEELSLFLPEPSLSLVRKQLSVVTRKAKSYGWSEEEKAIALSLFHASPKAYKMLKKFVMLPSVSTLRRSLETIQIYPGFNDNILATLKSKVASMPPNSDICALAFGEMCIKESVMYNQTRDEIEGLEDFGIYGKTQYVANHATVFMARGLLSDWKQAVGYVLSSGPIESKMLHTVLLQCIDKLAEAGLKVEVVIADQSSNNRKVFETLCGVTETQPFFQHNGKHIHVLYDPPHLLKSVRNNLKKSGFTVCDTQISWSHISEYYKFDARNKLRITPQLRRKHIELPSIASRPVKFAALVLSQKVAAGLSTLAQAKALPEEANQTAHFVQCFSQLFSVFNSSNFTSDQKMRDGCRQTSGNKDFLLQTLDWFSSVTSVDAHAVLCLKGWVMAIRTLLSLWEELTVNQQAECLQTKRFNMACVESLFSTVQRKVGPGNIPRADQFWQYLHQVMIDSLVCHRDASNRAYDTDRFLFALTLFTSSQHAPSDNATEAYNQPVAVSEPENDTELPWLMSDPAPSKEPVLEGAEDNVLTYISRYIARKLRETVCPQCLISLTGRATGDQSQSMPEKKECEKTEDESLAAASTQLLHTVKLLEATYTSYFQQILHMDKVRARLATQLEKVLDDIPLSCSFTTLPCPLKEKTVQLFLTIRLHFTVKESAALLSGKSAERKRKLMKVCHR